MSEAPEHEAEQHARETVGDITEEGDAQQVIDLVSETEPDQ